MKYLFINSVYGMGSTGKIIAEQSHKLQAQGHQCLVAWGRDSTLDMSVPNIRIGTPLDCRVHGLLTRCFDLHGFGSKSATHKFLQAADVYSPDVVWLHNIHGYYINIELLFCWLKRNPQIAVYWTLHDCWAFTGHCSHFTIAKCEQWKTGCKKCSQIREYPVSYGLDHTSRNYRRKKSAFTGVPNMRLITPSQWLANLTRESFLAEYPVEVVHNPINMDIFKPTASDFRHKYHLERKHIVLAVTGGIRGWEKAKGFPDMLNLRGLLPKEYEIILVGVTEKQAVSLPDGIIGIVHTENQTELAEIYTAADVFVNPTHQDNFPTVNLEARACGTPVITYDVGGSPESAGWEHIIKENDIEGLAHEVRKIVEV